jgi:AbrB family looped-hinge helix DNA binding protein
MAKSEVLGMKSATITSKGQITIPKELREHAGFKTGSKVVFITLKDRMQLIPMEKISDAMYASLMSEKVLAREWLTPEEDEAWKDL